MEQLEDVCIYFHRQDVFFSYYLWLPSDESVADAPSTPDTEKHCWKGGPQASLPPGFLQVSFKQSKLKES